jgi:hypothetical protein
MQYWIMRQLIEQDLITALNLAATSRKQATIFDDLAPVIRRESALKPTDGPLGVRDLIAVNARLSAGLHGGAAPRDWQLAVAACLMEAFMRFLFTDDDMASIFGRLDRGSVNAGGVGARIPIRVVEALLNALPLEQRTAAPPSRGPETWVIVGILAVLGLLLAAVVGWLLLRSRGRNSGLLPIGPLPVPPSGAGGGGGNARAFNTVDGVSTIASNLRDVGLSQQVADASVGSYTGPAATVQECESRCRADASCLQFVYDTNPRPAIPWWDAHGCWVRYQAPAPGDTIAQPGFVTGIRAA